MIFLRLVGASLAALFLLIASPTFSQVARRGQEDRSLQVSVDLVLLDVSVQDKDGQSITNLEKKDFTIYEDKLEQPISYFSKEQSPVTWGLVLDRSGSMESMIKEVYEEALHVIDEGTAEDEMFIVTFSDKPVIAAPLTSDRLKLQNSIFGLSAHGGTALYDAVGSALDYIKQGKHRKKALVVITDGADNKSRLSSRRLMERAKETDVLIYNVGMNGARLELPRNMGLQRRQLEQLAEVTGGYAYFPKDVEKCREAMARIAREVSEHYTIGYYPTNRTHDGRWRKSKVVVTDSVRPDTKYVVRTRSGYYASGMER